MTTIPGHFAILGPGGGWFTGYVPPATLWTQLDQQLSQCVNGDGGGTYAPTTPIILGGSGLQILGTPGLQTELLSVSTLLSMASGSELDIGGTFNVNSGGLTEWQAGANSTWKSGSVSTWQSGATFTVGCVADFNGNAVFAGNVFLNGGVAVADASTMVLGGTTDPPYGTPRSRFITQPPVVNGSPAALPITWNTDGASFTDGAVSNSQSYYWQFTKLINGATLASATINLMTGGTASTAGTANVSLWKCHSTGASTQIGATQTLSAALAANTLYELSVGPLTEVIDDEHYTYRLKIVTSYGAGAQPVTWFQPVVEHTNIAKLGQT